MPKTAAQERREQFKDEYWSGDIAWTGDPPEKGWFRAPRTLPLLLMLLSSKKFVGNSDAGRVYLELFTRHRDTGIVDMVSAGEHSYAAGYVGTRGIRTWQERMKLLEALGFIKSKKVGNERYKYVLIVHPTIVVQGLYDKGEIDQAWWDTYRQVQIENKEPSYEDLIPRHQPDKVVPIKSKKARKKTQKASS